MVQCIPTTLLVDDYSANFFHGTAALSRWDLTRVARLRVTRTFIRLNVNYAFYVNNVKNVKKGWTSVDAAG